MNLDIINIEVIKIYDRRNSQLAGYVHCIMEGIECIITKDEYDFIQHDYNRELRNDDLAFMKYLNNWN